MLGVEKEDNYNGWRMKWVGIEVETLDVMCACVGMWWVWPGHVMGV